MPSRPDRFPPPDVQTPVIVYREINSGGTDSVSPRPVIPEPGRSQRDPECSSGSNRARTKSRCARRQQLTRRVTSRLAWRTSLDILLARATLLSTTPFCLFLPPPFPHGPFRPLFLDRNSLSRVRSSRPWNFPVRKKNGVPRGKPRRTRFIQIEFSVAVCAVFDILISNSTASASLKGQSSFEN